MKRALILFFLLALPCTLWTQEYNASTSGEMALADLPSDILLSLASADDGAADEDDGAADLETMALYPNFPNPFNPSTDIAFDVLQPTAITLSVYDVLGQQVTTLARGVFAAGHHVISFDGSDLPPGLYFYRLEGEGFSQSRKMMLVK